MVNDDVVVDDDDDDDDDDGTQYLFLPGVVEAIWETCVVVVDQPPTHGHQELLTLHRRGVDDLVFLLSLCGQDGTHQEQGEGQAKGEGQWADPGCGGGGVGWGWCLCLHGHCTLW